MPFLKNKGHKWFWAPGTDSLLMSRQQLIELYCNSVGRGSVLLMNSSPDTTGVIPASHVAVYKDFGETIKRYFGKPIKTTSCKGTEAILTFNAPRKVNHVVIKEDLSRGQRVLEYCIEGTKDGKKWHLLVNGTSIGNKKIDLFDEGLFRSIRLRILKDKAVPYISAFSAFYIPERKYSYNNAGNVEKVIQHWEANTYSTDSVKEIELNLTPYMQEIGQYELIFQILGRDFDDNRDRGLDISNVNLNMYGHNMNTALNYDKGMNKIRIDRSQQTLGDFPIILKMDVKSRPCKTYGVIKLKKVVY